MYFLNEEMKAVSSKTVSCVDSQIFEFSIEDEDYMLGFQPTWDVIQGDFYSIRVGKINMDIPAGTYILCSCHDGNIDWIMIDELIGRDIMVLCISNSLRSWNLHPVELRDFHRNGECYFPMVRSPFPVTSEDCAGIVLVSSIDQHSKMKDKTFEVFFI
tara:strand:+ start:3077 stop:3550 length:474 start_codon:yes stop_codon:yes gene_type:complete